MRKAILIPAALALAFLAGCASDQIPRPDRPSRPARPGWIDPYPTDSGLQLNRPDRPYRPYPGLTPW